MNALHRFAELLPAAIFLFCILLVLAGGVAWLIDEWKRRHLIVGSPDRAVFREGSIERFREELRSGAAFMHNETETEESCAFLRPQA